MYHYALLNVHYIAYHVENKLVIVIIIIITIQISVKLFCSECSLKGPHNTELHGIHILTVKQELLKL